jgi:hypothetical protein
MRLAAHLTFALMLSACSQQPETMRAPAAPQAPAGSLAVPDAPAVPDSATGIMRITDIDFTSYSRDLASFVKLEVGESMVSATPKIENFFSPQGGSLEDARDYSREKTETEFSTFGAQGGKVTLVERVNIKDDSVKAEQFYAIFKAKGEGHMLVDYGMKIKCHRGENTENWQIKPCQ